MGPQGAGQERTVAVGGEDLLLGEGLGMGIMAEPAGRIGGGLVDAELVDAVIAAGIEGDAGAAGVDQAAHAVLAASGEEVLGTAGVGVVVVPPRSPDAGHGRGVKDGVDSGAGVGDGLWIANVTQNDFNGALFPGGGRVAAERADGMAIGEQLRDEAAA